MHTEPTGPHDVIDGARQSVPEQQPARHVIRHVMHAPPPDAPGSQSLPMPWHDWHTLPPAPHDDFPSPVWQRPLPSQHPAGQLTTSQMHAPPSQRWPSWHPLPPPQRHCPSMQALARRPQSSQSFPSIWQAFTVVGSMHTFPWQQPLGHVVMSQMHVSPTHAWPATHAAPGPHMHVPPTQSSPAAHAGPLPQLHRPPGRQVFPTPQSVHAPAGGPQNALSMGAWQTPLAQHPAHPRHGSALLELPICDDETPPDDGALEEPGALLDELPRSMELLPGVLALVEEPTEPGLLVDEPSEPGLPDLLLDEVPCGESVEENFGTQVPAAFSSGWGWVRSQVLRQVTQCSSELQGWPFRQPMASATGSIPATLIQNFPRTTMRPP